jgi:anti-sigma regulatory factor (Ser/Thr protein kinase)
VGPQATATHPRHDPGTRVSPVPADGRQTRSVRLTALPSAVPWARRVLRHVLYEWQVESIEDPAALLVSELVTNAVEASGGRTGRDHGQLLMIGLTIRLTAASLVLEVWDASPLRPVPQKADTASDRGRGLLLIDTLADSWGHRAANGGKIVWCELAVPPAPASTFAAS